DGNGLVQIFQSLFEVGVRTPNCRNVPPATNDCASMNRNLVSYLGDFNMNCFNEDAVPMMLLGSTLQNTVRLAEL
ncbi:hypothetical protein, partial [Bacteroides acidifaciens]|uniref:hypothetical protein n=1 Tax=Bacteroides acidifaciens TaxID=85831 RepID=UPI0025A5AAB4